MLKACFVDGWMGSWMKEWATGCATEEGRSRWRDAICLSAEVELARWGWWPADMERGEIVDGEVSEGT